jgi:hypothetical protein
MPYGIIEVMPIITDMKEKGNRALEKVPEPLLWLAIVLLSSSGSFGLGYLSGQEAGGGEVIIESRGSTVTSPEESPISVTKSTLQASPKAALETSPEPLPPAVEGGGQYVASKSGKSYHLPWCAGAKQIKEENKVYFNSKTEAEAAGYAPAKNCKGI